MVKTLDVKTRVPVPFFLHKQKCVYVNFDPTYSKLMIHLDSVDELKDPHLTLFKSDESTFLSHLAVF